MISTRSHTAVASKTSMSERHSLSGLGSKAKQIVENVKQIVENVLTTPQRICSIHNICIIADSITYRCWPQYSLKNPQRSKVYRRFIDI